MFNAIWCDAMICKEYIILIKETANFLVSLELSFTYFKQVWLKKKVYFYNGLFNLYHYEVEMVPVCLFFIASSETNCTNLNEMFHKVGWYTPDKP